MSGDNTKVNKKVTGVVHHNVSRKVVPFAKPNKTVEEPLNVFDSKNYKDNPVYKKMLPMIAMMDSGHEYDMSKDYFFKSSKDKNNKPIASFQSEVLSQTGILPQDYPLAASTDEVIKWAKDKKIYSTDVKSVEVGDQVLENTINGSILKTVVDVSDTEDGQRQYQTIFSKLNGNKEKVLTTEDSQDDFAGVIKFDKKVKFDGKIGRLFQGAVGDCDALVGAVTMSNSNWQKYINRAIKQDKDGNVTVTLCGVNKKYTFSSDDIAVNSAMKFSKADPDMVALEMAVQNHRKEVIASNKPVFVVDDAYNPKTGKGKVYTYPDGVYSYSKDDLANLVGRKDSPNPLEGTLASQMFYYLTGKTGVLAIGPKFISSYLDKFKKNPENYAISVTFENELDSDKNKQDMDKSIVPYHGYGLKKVNKDSVTLINPWNTDYEINVPKKDLLKHAKVIECLEY